MVTCDICQKVFTHPTNMYRHRREVHGARRDQPSVSHQPPLSTSPQQSTSYQPTPAKVRKLDSGLKPNNHFCTVCKVTYPSRSYFQHLRSNIHKSNCCQQTAVDGVLSIETTFRGRISTYRLPAADQSVDYGQFLTTIQDKVLQLVASNVSTNGAVKMHIELFGNYYLKTSGEYSVKSFNTKNEIVTVATDLNQLYQSFVERVLTKAREFNENKSGMQIIALFYSVCYISFVFSRMDPCQRVVLGGLNKQIQPFPSIEVH